VFFFSKYDFYIALNLNLETTQLNKKTNVTGFHFFSLKPDSIKSQILLKRSAIYYVATIFLIISINYFKFSKEPIDVQRRIDMVGLSSSTLNNY
jgi:hypothetical protein